VPPALFLFPLFRLLKNQIGPVVVWPERKSDNGALRYALYAVAV
jgi:hypothetical protein